MAPLLFASSTYTCYLRNTKALPSFFCTKNLNWSHNSKGRFSHDMAHMVVHVSEQDLLGVIQHGSILLENKGRSSQCDRMCEKSSTLLSQVKSQLLSLVMDTCWGYPWIIPTHHYAYFTQFDWLEKKFYTLINFKSRNLKSFFPSASS